MSTVDDAADVTHSTAFMLLASLVDEGQIAEERAQYLRHTFQELHASVLRIYRRDNQLLRYARQLRSDLDAERRRMHARADAARADDGEIQRRKKALREAEAELAAAQERESVLQVEVLECDRRKQQLLLEREDAVAAEEARLRPRLESMQAEISAMGSEVEQCLTRQAELKAQHEALLQEEVTCADDVGRFASQLAEYKQQLANCERDPERVRKQTQLVLRSAAAAQHELTQLERKAAAHEAALARQELQHSNRASDLAAAQATLQSLHKDAAATTKTLTTLQASLEAEADTRQGYDERLQELDQLLAAARVAARHDADARERLRHEKERQTLEYTTVTSATAALRQEEQQLLEQLRHMEHDTARVQHACAATQRQMDEAQRQLELHARQLRRVEATAHASEACTRDELAELADVEDALRAQRAHEEARARELAALATRRQELSSECARAAARAAMLRDEVASKDARLAEMTRQHDELARALQRLVDRYTHVKRERGQTLTQLQALTRTVAAVEARVRDFDAEHATRLQAAAQHDATTLQHRRAAHAAEQQAARLREAAHAARSRLAAARDDARVVRAQLRRSAADVAAVEDELSALLSRYTAAVEVRNVVGVQLIDRNDEVALLHERARAQEAALRDGAARARAAAEHVAALRRRVTQLQRDVDVCVRALPHVAALERELAQLHERLDDERWRIDVAADELTDPRNRRCWRLLSPVAKSTCVYGGKDDGEDEDDHTHAQASNDTTTAATATASDGSALRVAKQSTSSSHNNNNNDNNGCSDNDGDDDAPCNDVSELHVRLQARCDDLRARVERLDAQLREQTLVLREVDELSQRVGQQAEAGSEAALTLAQQRNACEASLRAKARQVMAMVAELSLVQAANLSRQQEVQRLEQLVDDAEARLRRGEAPFAEAEEEYVRTRASDQRYAAMLQRRKEERAAAAAAEDDGNDDDGRGRATAAASSLRVVRTTAIPRANAYVPDDALGLPVPYSAHAPFWPTAPLRVAAPRQPAIARDDNDGSGSGNVEANVSRRLVAARSQTTTKTTTVVTDEDDDHSDDDAVTWLQQTPLSSRGNAAATTTMTTTHVAYSSIVTTTATAAAAAAAVPHYGDSDVVSVEQQTRLSSRHSQTSQPVVSP